MLPVLATTYGVGLGTAANVVDRVHRPPTASCRWCSDRSAIASASIASSRGRAPRRRRRRWRVRSRPTFALLTLSRFAAGTAARRHTAVDGVDRRRVARTSAGSRCSRASLIGQMLGFSAGSLMGGLGAEHLGAHAPVRIPRGVVRRRERDPVPFVAPTRRSTRRATRARRSPISPPASRYVWRQRWARVVLLAVFLEGTFMFGAFAFIATHLHRHYGISLTIAGTLVMLYGLGGVVSAVLAPMLVRRIGEVGLAAGGGALICRDAHRNCGDDGPGRSRALALVLMGTGFYMLRNTLQTNATQMAPEKRGTAVSQFAASLFVGQSAGVALAGWVAERLDTDIVLVAGALGVLAVGLTFARLRRERQRARRARTVVTPPPHRKRVDNGGSTTRH